MFNLNKEVDKLKQLKHTKIHGIPNKPKQYDMEVQHIDGISYEIKAEQEHFFIKKGFRNRSVDFGRRLSKRRGQYHRPGGGFAGHETRG